MCLTILRNVLSLFVPIYVFWCARFDPIFQDGYFFDVSCDFFMHLSSMHYDFDYCNSDWVSWEVMWLSSGYFVLFPLSNKFWKAIDYSTLLILCVYSIYFSFYVLGALQITFISPIEFLLLFTIISLSSSFLLSLRLYIFRVCILF